MNIVNLIWIYCDFLTLINGDVEEIVAHSGNVNCLSLAKKLRRGLFITGGDDQLVNLWSIGKSAPLAVSLKISNSM